MNESAVKFTLTGLLSILSIWLQALAVPVLLLLVTIVLDYITGLMAAGHRGDAITSYRSMTGIAKKVCSLLLVAVGLLLDCLVAYVQGQFGLSFGWTVVFSVVVALWLSVNEIISILENIQDITGSLPGWLLPLVKHIGSKVEGLAPTTEKEDE